MRITFVVSSLQRGGAERTVSILANLWAERGNHVTVLSLYRGDKATYPLHNAVQAHALDLIMPAKNPLHALRINLRRVKVLRRAIRDSQPDVVISLVDVINVLTLMASRGLHVPVIVSERTNPARYDIGPVWSALRRFMYPFADAVVCQTTSVLEWFQKRTRIRGHVIPNPVALPENAVPVLKPAGRVVMGMGRLDAEKGFDLLLQAFSRVAGRYPEWSLKIVGEGPLRPQLLAQTETLNLAGRVEFPGAVSDPFTFLCAADLFVLSSRFEGFPNVLCEAMACGLPAIAFDCSLGLSELLHDNVNGIIVPAEDVTALAAALDRLMGDARERQRLGKAAPEILERLHPEKVLHLWEELFDELLPAGRHATGQYMEKAVKEHTR
jgi:glycosyltransferase involved in cell wall biosynthesis